MAIINFIRNHPNWIRILAVLNTLFIAHGIYIGVMSFKDGSEKTSEIAVFIAFTLLVGCIGSIGLWAITTRLIKYKPVIILLYIPCLFLSWMGVCFNYILFAFGYLNEFMKIPNTIMQVVVVVVYIFILICFWINPQNGSSNI